jgi:large subunit ribosomal protein L21
VISFKKRRRKNSKRKRGYRDEITVLRITEILADGNKPTIGPRPKKEKPVVTKTDDGDEDSAPKAAKKKAPAKKAVAKKTAKAPAKAAAKPRAKPDAKKKAPAKKAAAKKSEK